MNLLGFSRYCGVRQQCRMKYETYVLVTASIQVSKMRDWFC